MTVLLCGDSSSDNLVVAEGGPKGIRKFIKLMTQRYSFWPPPCICYNLFVHVFHALTHHALLRYTCRINWTEPRVPSNNYSISKSNADQNNSSNSSSDLPPGMSALPPGVSAEEAMENARFYQGQEGGEGEGEEEGDGDSDAEDEGGDKNHSSTGTDFPASSSNNAEGQHQLQQEAVSSADNRCDLLWQGQLPKRCFTGFKFHESQTAAAARKMMKARGVGHFWDMLEGADNLLASAAAPALF